MHEGDWEMIQLVLRGRRGGGARRSRTRSATPSTRAASGGAGTTKARADGTHPVVYPAAGSHANYYSTALWLGRSASEGFGCDDTTGPSRRVVPEARVVREPSARGDPYAWLAFEGNWGQKARGLFNAPSGPNTNKKWSAPIDWDGKLRDSSIAVPGGDARRQRDRLLLRRGGRASRLYADLLDSPLTAGLTLLTLGLDVVGAARLTRCRRCSGSGSWRPGRRPGGAGRRPIWWRNLGLLAASGSSSCPSRRSAAPRRPGCSGYRPSRSSAAEASASPPPGSAHLVRGDAAGVRDDARGGRRGGAPGGGRLRPGPGGLPGDSPALEDAPRGAGARDRHRHPARRELVGIPWAIRQAVRWVFIPQVVVFEGLPAPAARCLHRSAELVRGRWWRTAALVVLLRVIGLAPGVAGLAAAVHDLPAAGGQLLRGARHRRRAPLRRRRPGSARRP